MRYLLGFKGRASRAEWWAVNLAGLLPYIILFLLLPKGYDPCIAIAVLFAAVLFFMSYLSIACSVRRLHDRGKHGAWYFLNARKRDVFRDRHPLSLVSRPESASPATGSKAAHELEQKILLDEAFAG